MNRHTYVSLCLLITTSAYAAEIKALTTNDVNISRYSNGTLRTWSIVRDGRADGPAFSWNKDGELESISINKYDPSLSNNMGFIVYDKSDTEILFQTANGYLKFSIPDGRLIEEPSEGPWPRTEWLTRLITVKEIEARFTPDTSPIWLSEWETFRNRILPGDELWQFESPPITWQGLAGRAGYVIMRNGEPIAHLLTRIN